MQPFGKHLSISVARHQLNCGWQQHGVCIWRAATGGIGVSGAAALAAAAYIALCGMAARSSMAAGAISVKLGMAKTIIWLRRHHQLASRRKRNIHAHARSTRRSTTAAGISGLAYLAAAWRIAKAARSRNHLCSGAGGVSMGIWHQPALVSRPHHRLAWHRLWPYFWPRLNPLLGGTASRVAAKYRGGSSVLKGPHPGGIGMLRVIRRMMRHRQKRSAWRSGVIMRQSATAYLQPSCSAEERHAGR